MKLPLLWIAAGFVAGISLFGAAPVRPAVWLALSAAVILAGFGSLRRNWLRSAWMLGLVVWVLLGALAASLERLATPANLVSTLVDRGQLDTGEPLRWRGRLRNDPEKLPWGYRYEVDLDEVEVAGQAVPITGGLRASYFRDDGSPEAAPALRAGEQVEALVRARVPRNFMNPGAFDARGFLARQGIHVTGSLRSVELLRRLGDPPLSLAHRLARIRGRLLDRVDALYAQAPERAAVVRAMLLGDKAFVDHDLAEAFQKSAAYHVLVISGLHVGALAFFTMWLGRRLRLSLWSTTLLTLTVLGAYVAIVEDRPPIFRAALMAILFLLSRLLFRRVELLNTIALAALCILVADPSVLADPSFQLSFLAVGSIGALAEPWIERTSGPYRRALDHLGDATRDASHAPRAAQFRLDLRGASGWLAARLPSPLARRAASGVTAPCSAALRVWEIAVVSTIIQLGMLPLLAYYFHRVSFSGPLANIPAVTLAGLIVPLGFLALATSFGWPALGGVLARVVSGLVAALIGSVVWFARWAKLSYRVPGPPAWLIAGFFITLGVLGFAARSSRKDAAPWWRRQLLPALPLAALAAAIAAYPFAPRLARGAFELTVLDVGQGDSIFAAFPDGQTMLIDGGGQLGARRVGGFRTGLDVGEQVVSPYLWERGLKRLDVVALTHAHQDHLDGLDAVLENFQVRELWIGRDVSAPAFRALLERARLRGVRVLHRRRGDVFVWDGVTGLVLWPEDLEEAPGASNNDSLVLRFEQDGRAFLLPGDIEAPVERELVQRGDPLAANLLKVPHHGSRTSTTPELLGAVWPRLAVISVGENNLFGHPHASVLARLREARIATLRTDRDGAVTLSNNSSSLRVFTFAQGSDR